MQKIITNFIIIFLFYFSIAYAYSGVKNLPIHYSVNLTSIPNNNDSKIQKVWQSIKNKSLLINTKEKAVASSSDLLLLANSEYANILALLQNEAFYGGTISIKINGLEAHYISTAKHFSNNNIIDINVNPGSLYTIRTLSIKGALPNTKFKIKAGDLAEATDFKQLSLDLIKDLKNKGYSEAKIIQQKIIAYDKQQKIDFFLIINKGKKNFINNIKIINNSDKPSLAKNYIVKLSGFQHGILATPKKIDEYRKNLEQLDLFNSIIINQEASNSQGLADLTIIVTEKAKHNFSTGINYDTKDGSGMEISWLHRNLTHKGDHLIIQGSIKSLNNTNANKANHIEKNKQSYNSNYKLGYDIPGLIPYNMHLALELQGTNEHNLYYDSNSLGAKAGIYKILSNNWLASAYLTLTTLKENSLILHKRNFGLIGLDGNLAMDCRDDTLEPHKGYFWNLRFNPLLESRTSHLLARLELEARTYMPLDINEKYIIALRGQYGVILGSNLTNTPSSMQYYAGGSSSLRGFRYRSIGLPVYIDDNKIESAIGGLSLGALSAEIRAQLKGNFSGVAFIDTAAIGAHAFAHNVIKTGIGAGIRYKSPVGTIRFDLATPIKRNKYDGKFQFYMGIGEAF